jgi:hypothetical protein
MTCIRFISPESPHEQYVTDAHAEDYLNSNITDAHVVDQLPKQHVTDGYAKDQHATDHRFI